MSQQPMQTKSASSHCHKGHKADQPGGCDSQIQKQNQGSTRVVPNYRQISTCTLVRSAARRLVSRVVSRQGRTHHKNLALSLPLASLFGLSTAMTLEF